MPKILLVDDDPTNLELFDRFLKSKQYAIVAASDGPTCVRLAQEERPSLILMDMKLPELADGLNATREIRALEGMTAVPIIAVTGLCERQHVQEMHRAGCTQVIAKPVDFTLLHEKILNLLEEAKK